MLPFDIYCLAQYSWKHLNLSFSWEMAKDTSLRTRTMIFYAGPTAVAYYVCAIAFAV